MLAASCKAKKKSEEMSEFTEEKRAKALLDLNKIIEEDKDKYHVYHDIYHALQDSCNCRIPEKVRNNQQCTVPITTYY